MTHRLPLLFGLLTLLLVGELVVWGTLTKRRWVTYAPWSWVQILQAGKDIPPGTLVSGDMLNQIWVPELLVNPSMVRAEYFGYVIDQETQVPVQAGDPLLWAQFENRRSAFILSIKTNPR
jgi:hypothetical protein